MGMIQDFQKADKERRSEVAEIQGEVSAIRGGVATTLKEFATEDVERRSEVAGICGEVATIRGGVATMLKEFATEDVERRSEIAGICDEVATIRGGVATMFKDLAKEGAQRSSQVADIRSEVATMLNETDNMVKDLAKGSAQRRSEVKDMLGAAVAAIHEDVWGKAPPKKRVMPPKAAPMVGKLPAGLPAEEVVIEEAPAGELRDRAFAYLANHPDGARLTELEEEFGVARIQIARVIRALIDDNKVEKRDLLYFAI